MREIRTAEGLHQAEASFRSAFAKASDADPFHDRLPARLLIYPIDYTGLEASQFAAVARAAEQEGMAEAYVAGFAGEAKGWGGTWGHCMIDLSYDDYRRAWMERVNGLEHFCFPPAATWGLVTSQGALHALVAGSHSFISQVKDSLDYDEDAVIRSFLTRWRELKASGASVDWIPELLDHVLGPGAEAEYWPQARDSCEAPRAVRMAASRLVRTCSGPGRATPPPWRGRSG